MSLGCGLVKRTRRMPGDRTDGAEQFGEQRPQARVDVARLASGQLQVAAVAVDVLPEQRDLGDAVGGQAGDLVDDVVERDG